MRLDMVKFFETVEALSIYQISPFVKLLASDDRYYRKQALDSEYVSKVLAANTYMVEQNVRTSNANSIDDLLKERDAITQKICLTPTSNITVTSDKMFMQFVQGRNVAPFLLTVSMEEAGKGMMKATITVDASVESGVVTEAILAYFNGEMALRIRRYLRATGIYTKIAPVEEVVYA